MKSYTSFHPQTMPWDGVAASLLLSSNHQDKDHMPYCGSRAKDCH